MFVSYARANRALAEPIKRRLEALELDCFFDLEGIDGGAVFPDVITRALDQAKAVVACWSPLYFTRPWCLIEARCGLTDAKLLPVAVEAFAAKGPPADFRQLNYFDLSKADFGPGDENWQRTIRSLSKLVGRDIAIGAVPAARSIGGDTGTLADLRAAWSVVAASADVATIEAFQRRVRRVAPESGLAFEVELRLNSQTGAPRAEPKPPVVLESAPHIVSITENRIDPLVLPDVVSWPPLEFVRVGKGRFQMGSKPTPRWNGASKGRETPQHEVSLRYSLLISTYPVRVGAFAAFAREVEGTRDAVGSEWRDPGFPQTDDHPVVFVSWLEAQAFVRWLNKRLGLTSGESQYRLLSEAEWEYACRACTETNYSFGNDITDADARHSGLKYNNADGAPIATVAVGSYAPNALGLYDMHGNTWEWCQDMFQETYVGAPADGSAWQSGNGSARVVRGGSWNDPPDRLRSAYRLGLPATMKNSTTGFRVARAES